MKRLVKKQIAECLKNAYDAVLNGEKDGVTSMAYKFDDDFILVVGWSGGYESDNGHNGYEINAKIAESNYFDLDYGYLCMPWSTEDGEVWDTEILIESTDDFVGHAEWFIKEYKSMRKALDKNEITF